MGTFLPERLFAMMSPVRDVLMPMLQRAVRRRSTSRAVSSLSFEVTRHHRRCRRRREGAPRDYNSSSCTMPGLFSIPELQTPGDFVRLAKCAMDECDALRHDVLQQVDGKVVLFQLDAISRAVCNVIDAAELTRSVHASEEWRASAERAFGLLSDYMAQLNSDPSLYQALSTVVTNAAENNNTSKSLSEEEGRFAMLLKAEFERDGIHLPEAERERVRAIQGQIVELETLFSRNLVTCEKLFEAEALAVQEVIPPHVLASLGISAGEESAGKILLSNNSPTPILQTLLRYSPNPSLRRQVYMESMTAVPENLPVLDALMRTRHELATTLGFRSYSERFLRDQMAGTPQAVHKFLRELEDCLQPTYRHQMAILQEAKNQVEKSSDLIMPWDVSYYTTLLQNQGGGGDVQSSASAFFTLDGCLASLPVLVDTLFGIQMQEETALTENEQWDLRDSDEQSLIRKYSFTGPDGRPLGTLYLDLHSRPGKYNHAAHFTVRCGCRTTPLLTEEGCDDYDDYQLPIVALVCNLSNGAALSHGEVETLFHEFGHALHSLLSRTQFQHMSGTRGAMDFVETPSHLIEHYVWDAEFLRGVLGRHHATGDVMPDKLIDKLRRSRYAFGAVERLNQVLYAQFDQKIFGIPDSTMPNTTEIFGDLHSQLGIPYAQGTHWHSRFGHLVTYGAGYYSYLYAQVFAGDLWKHLFEGQSLRRESGERLWHGMLQHGGAKDPTAMLTDLLGRRPQVNNFEQV